MTTLRTAVQEESRRKTRDWLAVGTIAQFLRFGTVGTTGFLIDTAIVYSLRGALGLYGAGMVSYLVAASSNWALNRAWTFRGRGAGPAHRQWARFMVVCLVGFVLNRGTYAALVTWVPLCAAQPVFAVAAGSLAGMFMNFALSRRVVFI
jgi:putative flippase GtrA